MTVSLQPSVRIRTGRKEDITDIAKLLSASFYPQQGFWGWFSPLHQLWTYQDLCARFHAKIPQYAWMVGIETVNGSSNPATQLVGSVELSVRPLSPRPVPSGPVPYVSNLAVAANHRGQGIGYQLLLACEPTVQAWGWHEIYLHALEDNQPARRLYRRLGYQVQQEDYHWSTQLLGQPQRLLLRKQL